MHFIIRSVVVSLAGFFATACTQPETNATAQQAPTIEKTYQTKTLVSGSPFHGIHGLTFDAEDNILVGSVVGMNIHKVDPESGSVSLYQGPPQGMADDLEFSPDGTLVWTAIVLGELYAQSPNGEVKKIASGLPGLNSVAFKQDGRLFATQVFMGDALHEFDITGEKPPRKILENIGGLNGFDFGPDGKLYGPIWFKGQIVRIDVDTAELEVIADGFTVPAAVNFDSNGVLHAIDNETGEVFQVDISTGAKHLIARLPSNLDNLAFDSKDRLFVTNMSDNAIYQVNRETGAIRMVVGGPLTTPAGISLDGDTLYVADLFSLSTVSISDGTIDDISRLISDHEYPVAVTANGKHVVMGSSNAGFVQGYDKTTQQRLWRWTGFNSPGGLLELPDGSVLVAETGTGKILQVTGKDGSDRQVLAENFKEPMGMALAADYSHIFITDASAGKIVKIDLSNNNQTLVREGLAMPEAIAIDSKGALVIAETGARRVIRINQDNTLQVIAENLPIGLKGYPGLPASFLPTGIALGADDAIYLSSDIDNTILKITAQ